MLIREKKNLIPKFQNSIWFYGILPVEEVVVTEVVAVKVLVMIFIEVVVVGVRKAFKKQAHDA